MMEIYENRPKESSFVPKGAQHPLAFQHQRNALSKLNFHQMFWFTPPLAHCCTFAVKRRKLGIKFIVPGHPC